MADLPAKRRQRGVPSSPLAKLKTKVKGWIAKRGLTAVDLLSVEQVKARLHTLDTEFKRYHMDVIDSLDNKSEIGKEHEVMDEHKNRAVHIVISLKSISSSSPTTTNEPAATIKTES